MQYISAATGSGNWRYLHADHQGSITAHSNTSGSQLAVLSYDAYGIPKSTNSDRFGFTGQVWLKELGLYHYKARMYSPRLGRFLQTAPIFYADNMNMYAYVGNDPFNKSDSTGTQTEILEEVLVTAPKPIENPFCWCHVGVAAQALVNEMAEQQQRNMAMAMTAVVMASSMLNESSTDEGEVQEEYDSLEDAVGATYPLDEVEKEGKTKDAGLRGQGYTEKWTGVDSNGSINLRLKIHALASGPAVIVHLRVINIGS